MKLVISLIRKSEFSIKIDNAYHQNVAYMDCCLSEEGRLNIALNIFQKIMGQQAEFIQSTLLNYQSMILGLVQTHLVDLNRLESFLYDLVENIIKEER